MRANSTATRRTRSSSTTQVVEHPDEDDKLSPEEYLDRHHPENDSFMKAMEHVQRQLLHQTTILRTKQVNILKTVFSGASYVEAARTHGTTATTVSKLVKSEKGRRLLNLLQYHLNLIEGPNIAQRRALLGRIAFDNEESRPDTSIKAVQELNRMNFKEYEGQNPNSGGQQPTQSVTINICQDTLPRGALDN